MRRTVVSMESLDGGGMPNLSMQFYRNARTIPKSEIWEQMSTHFYGPDYQYLPIRILATGISRWYPGEGYVRKGTEYPAFGIVTQGTAEVTIDGVQYELGPGKLFHSVQGGNISVFGASGVPLHKRFLVYGGILSESIARGMGIHSRDVFTLDKPERSIGLFRTMHSLMTGKPSGFEQDLSSLLYRLLMVAATDNESGFPTELRRAVEHIDKNLTSTVTLRSICEAACVARRTCNRLFLKYLGNPPMKYCEMRRMDLAGSLLRDTTQPVGRIAYTLGFTNPKYFATIFRRHFGESPSKYRINGRIPPSPE